MFSFLYNRLYKKIFSVLVITFIAIFYIDEIPYPLILNTPKSEDMKISNE